MQRIKDFINWIKADKKRVVGAIVVLTILVFSILYIVNRGNKNKTTYQTATATKGTIVSTISASGKVLSTNTFSINTQATGVVKKVYVVDGDVVKAGQKISEISLDSDGALANTKAWAALISSQNSLGSANNSYRSSQASLQNVYDQVKGHDSDETLVQKETRTKAEVANDNAFDGIRSATANLASAALSYKQTSPVIYAPNSGIIGSVGVVEGMNLVGSSSTTSVNSQRVAVVKNDSLPIVAVTVNEIDVPSVKVGQKATITFDSITDKTFTGVIATVDRIGTVSSNVTSYTVNIKLDTNSDQILPNMALSADIIINTKTDVLTVPSAAVTTQNGESEARVLRNGVEVRVPVEVGISSDIDVEIISGLSEGDVVITGTSTAAATPGGASFSPFGGGFGGGAIRTGGAGAQRRGN